MGAPGRFTGNYRAFLLRLTRAAADQPWEIVAKDVETGEEYPLADPDALIAFLTERVPAFERREQPRRQ
jgi:hypothetical protein